MNSGLFALALGAFAVGTTEFAPMGLLPVIASDLGVSIPTAGLLISAFALGVVVSAPVLALFTGRMSRRTLLIAMAGILTAGNLMSALSDSYAMMFASRVLTSFNMGTYFGIGSLVAASLVPKDRQASAVATMFTGLALSNVVGVPVASWVGEHFGWRMPFWGIAAMGVVVMITLRATLPPLPGSSTGDPMSEVRAMLKPNVLLALVLTVLSAGAWFSVFTYIAPILRDATHATPAFTAAMLLTFGVGITIGNALGGRFADRSADNTLIAALVCIVVMQIALALFMPYAIPTAIIVFLWGIGCFAIVPPLQMRVITAAAESPNLASSANISAFNSGNALGAAIGGGVIASGAGYPAVALIGAGAAFLGLLIVLATRAKSRSVHAKLCRS